MRFDSHYSSIVDFLVVDHMKDSQRQAKPDPIGVCHSCSLTFDYSRIDNQINDSWYIYCATCGATGLLHSAKSLRADILEKSGYELASEAEPFLPACRCGGTFKSGALPRCPYCRAEFNRDVIIEMLDHFYSRRKWSAATSAKGCLQNCLVINKRIQYLFSDDE